MQQLQVTITDATGAVKEDNNSIVSIRAASSRRQGAVQLKRALHFPVSMADASPFKVDVLKKVAEGELTVRAEDADYNCELRQVGASPAAMNMKLQIRSAPHLCGRSRQELKVGASAPLSTNAPEAPIKEPPPAMPAELTAQTPSWPELQQAQQGAAIQARQYFDNHNIMHLVQALLEALIRDQPQEPFSYIGTFMDRLSEALPQKPPVKAGDDALEGPDTCAVAREQNPEWTAIFDANQKQGVVGVDDFCIAIRSVHPHLSTEQAKALCEGIARGDTGVNLAGFCAAANSVAEGDAMAAEVAGMRASKFAELGRSKGSDMGTVRAQMRDLLVTSLEDGRLEKSLSMNAFERVREKAAKTLYEAASAGTLDQVLESVKKVRPPDERVPANPPPPSGPQAVLETVDAVEDTRQKVKLALVQACDDGRLQTSLRDIWAENGQNKELNQEELHKIREKARNMLLESAGDGRLQFELLSLKNGRQAEAKQAELDAIFQKMRGALVESVSDGRLAEALKNASGPAAATALGADRLEELKRQASETLTKAFHDGRLAGALEGSKQAREAKATDFEQVRLKTKQMLTEACQDGSLEKALRDTAPEAAGAEPEDSGVANMVRDLLVSAAVDGRLEESLTKMANADSAQLASREIKEPGPMDFQPLDFHFDCSMYCMIDDEAFKKDFFESLEYDVGVDKAVLNRLVVVLREGSVIARVHGPSADMSYLRTLPLEATKVQGDSARIEEADDTLQDETFMDLQTRALSALVAASKDGSLQNALLEVKGTNRSTSSTSPTDAMFDAIDTDKDNWISRAELREALKNGTLSKYTGGEASAGQAVTKSEPAQTRPPDARNQAAATAGSQAAKKSSIDDIRLEMKQLLAAACDSGALEKALGEVKAPVPKQADPARSKDSIREELKQLLEASCDSGALAKALAEIKVSRMGDKSAPPEATSRELPADLFAAPPQASRETAEKRDPAQADEAKAASAQAVKLEKMGTEDFKALKEKAKTALVKSSKDGSLQTALAIASTRPKATAKPEAPAKSSQDDDKYSAVRQLAGRALVQAIKDGRLDTAVTPSAPRRPSTNRFTVMDFNVSNLVSTQPDATVSTAPAPPAVAQPQSSRHADLLAKQRELLEQKQAYEAQLRELKDKNAFKPVPPSGSKPFSKRPLGVTVNYRELKEVNASLCQENSRLNAEMARLLARLSQSEAGK